MNSLPFPCPLSERTIRDQRAEILGQVLRAFPVLEVSPPPGIPLRALNFLLAAYDAAFFGGFLARNAGQLRITGSTRLVRAAGKCIVTKPPRESPRIEVRMGVDFLLRLGEGPFEVNGQRVATGLEAFLSVLEHELCHAADFLLYGGRLLHGPAFRGLATGLFGHTRCIHALPTRASEAAARGCGVGHWVRFEYQGRTLRGVVSRVGKTATVMVPSSKGAWTGADGRRYGKYAVPPAALTPSKQ
jgi:hypothetical protein